VAAEVVMMEAGGVAGFVNAATIGFGLLFSMVRNK
jgi:hypothetical protein